MLATTAVVLSAFALVGPAYSSPINTAVYREIFDAEGLNGGCRGNGGPSDRVDSKFKNDMTQQECETACDTDPLCVAYSFGGVGDCGIYGDGVDGTCSLATGTKDERYHSQGSCGNCAVGGMAFRMISDVYSCGTCSKDMDARYAPTSSLCKTTDTSAVWNEGTWSAGVWTTADKNGWIADSHPTGEVHTVHAAAEFHCYDKAHSDGQPTCTGNGGSCQTSFDNLRTMANCPAPCTFVPRTGDVPAYCYGQIPETTDNDAIDCMAAFDVSKGQADCQGISGACTYVEAPAFRASLKIAHSPVIDLGSGWQREPTRAFGDAVNIEGGEGMIGACRYDQAGMAGGGRVNYKYCKNCLNSKGEKVSGGQEACKQACLDDPSGTCHAYGNADNSWCLIFGMDVDQHPHHPGDMENAWVATHNAVDSCMKPNYPLGCKTIDTAKPNPSYICMLMDTENTRWEAWGAVAAPVSVEVTLHTHGGDGAFTSEHSTMLADQMAHMAFMEASDVEVTTGPTDVKFTVATDMNRVAALTGLLESAIVSRTRDVRRYFTSDMFPEGAMIVGSKIDGHRLTMADASKTEPTHRSWGETGAVMGAAPPTECDQCEVCAAPAPATPATPTAAPSLNSAPAPACESSGVMLKNSVVAFAIIAMLFNMLQ